MRRVTQAGVALAALSALAGCSLPTGTPAGTSTPTGAASATQGTATPSSSTPDALGRYYGQRLSWTPCQGDFQCATLTVPRSYDEPAGPTIGINLIRLPAANPDARLGSLVLNPGGPGGSGIDYARAARAVTSDSVRERYDIVGFDPRGVASSDPLRCQTDEQTDAFIAADASPDDATEVQTLARLSEQLGELCRTKASDLLEHVGTRDVARDLDVLRAALGDPRLNYLGKSYGTAIGATYADEFPQNVGRMVLDGAIDPALDATALAEGQAGGFELALRRFVERCPELAGCPLDPNPETALRQVRDFLAAVDRAPLTTDQPGRPLTEALAVLGILGSLYSTDDGWPTLARALGSAFDGNGSDLLSIGDYYTDRGSDGRYASNANDVIYAVNCWDKPASPGVEQTQQLAAEWSGRYPIFGSYLAWGNLPCATWPGHSSVAPGPIAAEGSAPILVVGTVNDPATPVQWARSLAAQLAAGAYLEWTGDGHTAYERGSVCVDEKVDAYLIDGTVPDDGTVCD